MNAARILIVEDQKIVSLQLRTLLTQWGYEVLDEVTSGERAIRRAREVQPDVVLMDVMLEGDLDGVDASSYIQDILHIPVIFLTGCGDEETFTRAKQVKPYGYILKPVNDVELRFSIELALERHLHGKVKPKVSDEPVPRLQESHHSTAEQIAHFPLFGQVPVDDVARFVACCKVTELAKGDVLVWEGDDKQRGFLVLEGLVGLLKTSLQGREIVVDTVRPTENYGIIGTIETDPSHITVTALVNTKVLLVPRSALTLFLSSHPQCYRPLVNEITSRLRNAHHLAKSLALDKVESRIASLLSQLQLTIGTGDKKLEVYISRNLIANMTGTTLETASRVSKQFESLGIIDVSRPGLVKILNLRKLHELAEQ
jgi:CRP-like cAMP-binding protein/FixJ family two-component response regulator